MRVLIDTNVVSESQRAQGDPIVRERLRNYSREDTYVSALTIGEIAMGIALMDEGRCRMELTYWLQSLEAEYGRQILPVDADVARIWGEVSAIARRQGSVVAATDGLIAATALRHGLHVVTRNVRHFLEAGALVINPWSHD